MWRDEVNGYYWRGRYDATAQEIKFEYISQIDLANNTWAENANAAIVASGFSGYLADFVVRGAEAGVVTTIHYSDGIDTWVAESNEATATGWAWINTTKVFDGTSPDHYRRVNLCANRKTPTPKLYATAVFTDDSEGTEYVVAKIQSVAGDITGWGASKDVSDNTNTDTIYGQSIRSMAESGAEKDDALLVYKEGDALKSQYFSGGVLKGIQTIDATTYSGKSMFDLEHALVMGIKMGHVIYVDSDGAIKWSERYSGATTAWTTPVALTTETSEHGAVGIVEHGSGIFYTFWKEGELIKYRLHRCEPEIWVPALGDNPSSFDVSVDAVIDTITTYQIQTPDQISADGAIPLVWIGQIGVDNCEIGWGIPVASTVQVYTRNKELTLPADDSDLGIFFIPSEYVDVATDDDIYVQQCARDTLDPYGVFLWKDQHTKNTDIIISTCILKASIAPSVSTVYLQVYNQTDNVWETLDSDNVTAADTEFTLNGSQTTNLSKYYDNEFWVTHRIYQKAEQ